MAKSQTRAAHKTGKNAREIILNAARAEFAEKGFNGARVDSIAARSGLNKQLVYYFRSAIWRGIGNSFACWPTRTRWVGPTSGTPMLFSARTRH
jgi:hypothetical protein